ncbi:FimD/PapC C-terminal domain-containing protein, partial [Escherichia coli]|uniref:FimD/PapC C-terminal domain-containing protein n=1 Tax=Escherichia coli TaxID=562 RepID=UPI001FCE6B29
ADRNRSHWSTSKTPSYTKSVSWQHHQTSHKELGLVADGGFVYLNGIQDDSKLTLRWGDKSCFIQPPNSSNLTTGTVILPCISQN